MVIFEYRRQYPRITKTDYNKNMRVSDATSRRGLSEDFKYSDRIYIPEEMC